MNRKPTEPVIPPAGDIISNRVVFSESNTFLRSARDAVFAWDARDLLALLRQSKTDSAKRKTLRHIAENMQQRGLYSSKIAIGAVEQMVLTKLFRYTGDSEWESFADKHAGSSYRALVPYRNAIEKI
jgi:hypothetical protein